MNAAHYSTTAATRYALACLYFGDELRSGQTDCVRRTAASTHFWGVLRSLLSKRRAAVARALHCAGRRAAPRSAQLKVPLGKGEKTDSAPPSNGNRFDTPSNGNRNCRTMGDSSFVKVAWLHSSRRGVAREEHVMERWSSVAGAAPELASVEAHARGGKTSKPPPNANHSLEKFAQES